MAGNAASLLELSYRLTRNGTTIQEMSIQEQQMRAQQQTMMLYYLGMQAGLSSVQAYNAAGSAIRMDGATVAAPGYESVASDYQPFQWQEYDIEHGYNSYYNPTQAFINRDVRTINGMTREQMKNALPQSWKYYENNGRIHIKDENGNYVIRIDPPDNVTTYQHMHIYNFEKSPLDIDGNIVTPKDPAGHIPWNN